MRSGNRSHGLTGGREQEINLEEPSQSVPLTRFRSCLLNQWAGHWLIDSQILKYEASLLEKDDLILTTDTFLNPTSFLWAGEAEGQSELSHSCIDLIEYQTRVRPDLRKTPLGGGMKLFIDGSSWMIEGKRHNGYAIIDGDQLSIYMDPSTMMG